jgi:hypothetical protein
MADLNGNGNGNGTHGFGPNLVPTGNTLITFAKNTDKKSMVTAFRDAGLGRSAVSSDYEQAPASVEAVLAGADSYIMEDINVAVVKGETFAAVARTEAMGVLARSAAILEMRPEYYCFTDDELQQRYMAWLQESAFILSGGLRSSQFLPGAELLLKSPLSGPILDTVDDTWGILAVSAHLSPFSGQGIKVAVLDTGFDDTHPNFQGRIASLKSFVPGEAPQDGHGHGTHCIGTSCGPLKSATHPRYGVAHKAEILAVKVLSNSGSGAESWILQGMQYAVNQGAKIVSMSLGRAAASTDPSPAYTNAGQFALDNDAIIIAAAGNSSSRPGFVAPVGAPANSPTIMAVAAVDSNLDVASFSCGGLNGNGGEVNISGPGVNVFSSVPVNKGSYRRLSGTSMATPHVAGCAALWAQSDSSLRGMALWKKLEQSAKGLGGASDFGTGLVQSPLKNGCPKH